MSKAVAEPLRPRSRRPRLRLEVGGALGVATLGSVGAAVYRSQVVVPAGVPAASAAPARESIGGAVSAADQLPAPLGAELFASAGEAFSSGLQVAAGLGAVVFALLACLAVAMLRQVPAYGAREPERADEDNPADVGAVPVTSPSDHRDLEPVAAQGACQA